MNLKIPTRYLVYGLILALLSLFLLGWGIGSSKQKKSLTSVIDSLKYEITLSKVQLDKKTVYLAKVSQELTTERELRKRDIADKETLRKLNLKKANEVDKLSLQVAVLSKEVSHSGQVITIQQEKIDSLTNQPISVKKNAILLPFSFNYPSLNKPDPYLSFSGHFDNNGNMKLDSLNMPLKIDVFTGLDKKKEPICILSTTNPYIKTLGLASYKTDPPKKRRYGIGLQIGYGVNLIGETIKPTPYIGVGVSCNFIRF